MYVWAQNAILGGLEGLCLAGPAFELANPPSDFSILRVPQEEIDAWGESLRVSVSMLQVRLITVIRLINR